MKTYLTVFFGILPFVTFAQYPPPENFDFIYEYIMLNESGFCAGESVVGPTYCSYFEWNTPDTSGLSTILEYYNIYVFDHNSGNTDIIASLTDTIYHVEMGIIGEIWITAVYSNPDGESAPSNVEINIDLPISVENNNENNKIRISYDNNFEMIKINNSELIRKIKIFNISGRLVKSINYSINDISLSDLPTGMYIVEIVADNYTMKKKIIK